MASRGLPSNRDSAGGSSGTGCIAGLVLGFLYLLLGVDLGWHVEPSTPGTVTQEDKRAFRKVG
ncbi:MAG: hypothetical protein QOI57_3086 [Rubrobacteraceae bacterium]|nr:hypothetical protein [Rubrobacteraceae bacterium]